MEDDNKIKLRNRKIEKSDVSKVRLEFKDSSDESDNQSETTLTTSTPDKSDNSSISEYNSAVDEAVSNQSLSPRSANSSIVDIDNPIFEEIVTQIGAASTSSVRKKIRVDYREYKCIKCELRASIFFNIEYCYR